MMKKCPFLCQFDIDIERFYEKTTKKNHEKLDAIAEKKNPFVLFPF